MDRFESMTVLLAIVDAGSLSAAGRKLGMPLATVSRNLAELESRLKAQLVARSSRQLVLTDAGRGYVEACRRIVDAVGSAEREVRGEFSAPKGRLLVTAPIVFGRLHVLPVVAAFLDAYPDVDVRLMLGDRVVPLLEDEIDLAVRIGELPDSNLVATRLGLVRLVVCGSPAYLARSGTPQSPADLTAHRCVIFEALTGSRTWRFDVQGADSAIVLRSRLTVNTAEAAVDAALADVGLTRVLSYQVESALEAGRLVPVLEAFEPPPVPVSLVHPNPGRLPLKVRAFLDYATPRLRDRLKTVRSRDTA